MRYNNNEQDESILASVKNKFKFITKAFKNPNADY
jgi:hypothetical protein